MRIVVTGATGFIGRNIVETLAADRPGPEIVAVRHTRPLYELPARSAVVQWKQADLTDPAEAAAVVDGADVVIHAAAVTSGALEITERPEIHVTENTVMNSWLFRAAHDAGVRHVIAFSCAAVYRSGPSIVRESAAITDRGPYLPATLMKIHMEDLARFYAGLGRTKFTVIRHSNVYGPHDKFDDPVRAHVLPATIAKVAVATAGITIWGKKDRRRDFMHVSDLVRFVELVIERQDMPYGRYNVGTGATITLEDMFTRIILLSGKKLRIDSDPSKPTMPSQPALDCAFAERMIGWKPTVGLTEGLRSTIDWYAENRRHLAPTA